MTQPADVQSTIAYLQTRQRELERELQHVTKLLDLMLSGGDGVRLMPSNPPTTQNQTDKKQPRRVAERRVLKKIPKSAGTLRKNANLDKVPWKEVAELTEVPFEKEPDPIPVRENLLKPIPIPQLPVPVTEYEKYNAVDFPEGTSDMDILRHQLTQIEKFIRDNGPAVVLTIHEATGMSVGSINILLLKYPDLFIETAIGWGLTRNHK